MKKSVLFIAAAAVLFSLASCNKSNEPNSKPGTNPSEDPGTVTEKSNKCDILTFSIQAGETEIVGDVSAVEKKVVLPVFPEDMDAIVSAKAVYTLSEGATISPDPAAQAMDYSKDIKLTVTAEDGTTTKEYTVSSRAVKVKLSVNKVWEESKTLGQLKIIPAGLEYNTQMFAFAGTDKFVACDLQVFDLDGNALGKMNTTGIKDGWIPTSLTNDPNGVVVACFSDGIDNTLDNVTEGGIYAWVNGYDQAPKELWSVTSPETNDFFPVGTNRDFFELCVGGDVKGDFVMTTYHFLEWNGPWDGVLIGTYIDLGMHNVFVGKGGEVVDHTVGYTIHTAGDANCWQQMIPVSGNPDGQYVICDSQKPGGIVYFVQEGSDEPGSDIPLYGTLTVEQVGEEGAEGAQNYGNYTCGQGFVVRYFGRDYLIAATEHWHGQYLTVQTLDPTDEDHIVYPTTEIGTKDENRVSVAAIFDEEAGVARILYATHRSGGEVFLYEMNRETL